MFMWLLIGHLLEANEIKEVIYFSDLCNHTVYLCLSLQWQHEDILGSKNQPLCVSVPPRSVILNNIKKKLYKLSQDEGAIVAVQVSITIHVHCIYLIYFVGSV